MIRNVSLFWIWQHWDILDNLGVGDKIVGSASTSLEYLSDYVDNEKVANLGTIKEADLEAVMECEPEVIFIGGRLASSYDVAPVKLHRLYTFRQMWRQVS